MDSGPILDGVKEVTSKWTRQRKAEERSSRYVSRRETMWTPARTSLKTICHEHMEEAWNQASDNGRLPTHWRQIFYVMRKFCDGHPESDRPLLDSHFKQILEEYLVQLHPGWDVVRGARGVFKEPHAAENDRGLAMSTLGVRSYLRASPPDPNISTVESRFPTSGAHNRIAAVLICEKEGFDELLSAERVPERFDLALMSTKGISAVAARDLASGLGVPCFTLHDMDKNGFVMAAGFPFATDIGIRMEDVDEWGLEAETQHHRNRDSTLRNLLRNGASQEEAEFISEGQRVELNMLTGPDFISLVEEKLRANGVEKVIPDAETLKVAWRRAHAAAAVNKVIRSTWQDGETRDGEDVKLNLVVPPAPDQLRELVVAEIEAEPELSWDEALYWLCENKEKSE